MQLGFYFDQSRCVGCYTCAVSCKDRHDIPAGPENWIRIKTIEKGKFPHPFLAFLMSPCYHCAQPACIKACPADAITKRPEDGVVVVDSEACLGKSCGLCLKACPYGGPQFGAEEEARMRKCDLCLDRWQEGKKPICAEACPMHALDAGPMDELVEKYGDQKEAVDFNSSKTLRPSVRFKKK